jgi:hypothetical protein
MLVLIRVRVTMGQDPCRFLSKVKWPEFSPIGDLFRLSSGAFSRAANLPLLTGCVGSSGSP